MRWDFSGSLPEFTEDKEVHEVHRPEDEENDPKLSAERLENSRHFLNLALEPEKEAHEADVDKVESHHKKVVHTVGHFGVSTEAID